MEEKVIAKALKLTHRIAKVLQPVMAMLLLIVQIAAAIRHF